LWDHTQREKNGLTRPEYILWFVQTRIAAAEIVSWNHKPGYGLVGPYLEVEKWSSQTKIYIMVYPDQNCSCENSFLEP
jgi:hypothetical protein